MTKTRIAFLSLVVAFCGCGAVSTRRATNDTSAAGTTGTTGTTGTAPAAPKQFFEGKLRTIRGHYVPESEKHDYYSANMTQNLFEVTSIDGQPVSQRAELVDPPKRPAGAKNPNRELTLVGYFYEAVATGSLVPGVDPPGTQGHAFFYATKFKVKRPSE